MSSNDSVSYSDNLLAAMCELAGISDNAGASVVERLKAAGARQSHGELFVTQPLQGVDGLSDTHVLWSAGKGNDQHIRARVFLVRPDGEGGPDPLGPDAIELAMAAHSRGVGKMAGYIPTGADSGMAVFAGDIEAWQLRPTATELVAVAWFAWEGRLSPVTFDTDVLACFENTTDSMMAGLHAYVARRDAADAKKARIAELATQYETVLSRPLDPGAEVLIGLDDKDVGEMRSAVRAAAKKAGWKPTTRVRDGKLCVSQQG